MPNNCFFSMTIKGKPKDIKAFCKLFIFSNEEGKKRKPYFARTFLDNWESYQDFIKEKKEDIKTGEIDLFGWCAWSCWSCWFEGYPQDDKKKRCLTLQQAVKKYKVEVEVESEEGGFCFEERIKTRNGKVSHRTLSMPEWICKKCKERECVPSWRDMNDYECSNCGSYKWRKVK